jgi:hypothetical protein
MSSRSGVRHSNYMASLDASLNVLAGFSAMHSFGHNMLSLSFLTSLNRDHNPDRLLYIILTNYRSYMFPHTTMMKPLQLVLGIRDILVRIRIRIPRSIPLTNGFLITCQQAHHLQSKKFNFLLKICVSVRSTHL